MDFGSTAGDTASAQEAGSRRRLTDRRREEIIHGASDLFIAEGYAAVTIDKIIARVGGSKTTLYREFGGKPGLFAAVVSHHCAEVRNRVSLNFDHAGSPVERLTRIGISFMEAILSDHVIELHRIAVSAAPQFPEVARQFEESGPLRAYGLVGEWFAKLDAEGVLQIPDPATAAILFLDMLTGHNQLLRLLSPCASIDSDEIGRTAAEAARVFVRAYSRPS